MTCDNPNIHTNLTPILDRGNEDSCEIRVRKWECLKYLLFPVQDGRYIRSFIVEEGAVFCWAGIALWADMVLEMSVYIEWSRSEASVRLLGLATSESRIELDGVGRVSVGCQDVKLRVDQTNILLGSWAKVKGRPVLEVATDSIEWGHSCRIHRISGEALFYLESHGIDSQTAEGMLLTAEIHKCTDLLSEEGEGVKWEILERLKIGQ